MIPDVYDEANHPIRDVIDAADRAEPRRVALDNMAETLIQARAELGNRKFDQERVDRWRYSNPEQDVTVELGYVHGEVWFRAWNTNAPDLRLEAQTRRPGETSPLWDMLADHFALEF